MPYLGSWKVDDLLTFPAITHRFDTGALTDADAVPAYRVYEDETGTAILTGNMAKLDDTNTTGFYSEQITLSAANGFEKGKCYTVYITAAVNSVTGGQNHTFQIEAEVDSNSVSNIGAGVITAAAIATDAIDADAIADNAINAAAIATGAITSAKFAAGAIDAAAIAADAIGASELAADAVAEIADAVWDEDATGHQTQGTFGQAIGDPGADTDTIWALANTNLNATVSSRASQTSVDTVDDFLDTEVAAIKAKTDQLTFGTANRVDAQVFGIEANAITAASIASAAITNAKIAAGTIDANVIANNAIGAAELAADAVAEIADAVWDEAQSGHTTAGTFGKYLDVEVSSVSGGGGLTQADIRTAVGLASANLDTQLTAIDDAIDTEVAAIKAKTDQLTFTTANRVDSQVFGMQAGSVTAAAVATGAIDADAIAADAVTEIQSGLSTLTAGQVNAEVVDALATDTYAEPGQGAPAATATLAAKINYLYKAWRNRHTQTATQYSLYGDDATTVHQKSTVSDNGTTADRGEVASGP